MTKNDIFELIKDIWINEKVYLDAIERNQRIWGHFVNLDKKFTMKSRGDYDDLLRWLSDKIGYNPCLRFEEIEEAIW